MRIKTNNQYKLSHILPILGLAGASVVSSCEKIEPIERPKTVIEYKLQSGYPLDAMWEWNQIYTFSGLETYLAQDYIDTIYIVPTGTLWPTYSKQTISDLRNQYLEPLLNKSPKIRGRGDFDFKSGINEPDSLWFIKNGWTINQQQH